MEVYNYYCDESGHLPLYHPESDIQKTIVLGTVYCKQVNLDSIKQDIIDIKEKHNIPIHLEIKWTKVSKAKENFYFDIVKYFFENDDLHFRCIITNKKSLDYTKYSHDELYYIMYYFLLENVVKRHDINNIYIDKKDTRGKPKVAKLKSYLKNKLTYYPGEINKVQVVNSNEIALMQLTDLFIGAMAYFNNNLYQGIGANPVKQQIIKLIQTNTRHDLSHKTSYRESKFNIFYWGTYE
jgi:hypothetical protein